MPNNERVYQIRRAILNVLKDYNPAPADLDDIQCHPAISALNASVSEILAEMNALTTCAYITDIHGFNGRMKTINERGLKQINQEGERDIFIWGKYGRKE